VEIDYSGPSLIFSNSTTAGTFSYFAASSAAGLWKESVALCHQVTTLDRSKFARRIGQLSWIEISQIEAGLKATLDLL
jgi:mRNA-degrading endonuclease toxin of MazEF toxin-antitoxin module